MFKRIGRIAFFIEDEMSVDGNFDITAGIGREFFPNEFRMLNVTIFGLTFGALYYTSLGVALEEASGFLHTLEPNFECINSIKVVEFLETKVHPNTKVKELFRKSVGMTLEQDWTNYES